MAYQPSYAGYPAQVWATCYQSLSWLNMILSTSTAIGDIDNPTNTVFTTLLNGINAIDAWQTANTLAIETQNLLAVQALPLSLDTITQEYFVSRATGVTNAAEGIATLPPLVDPLTAVPLLTRGQPAIADPQFLEWCATFNGEVPVPSTLLPGGASTVAQAWLAIALDIFVLQGGPVSTAFDTAARMYRCSVVIANMMMQLQSGPFAAATDAVRGNQLTDSAGNLLYDSDGNPLYDSSETINYPQWNSAVALPTILLDAATLMTNPASIAAQQSAVIRNALIVQLENLANLLLALRTHNIVQPVTATLYNGESLADLAARTTGNFENWPALATTNNISPPYPGPTQQAISLSGRSLFITNQGIKPDADSKPPTYANNVLGIDWDWGPINGIQPAWKGDIALITGYYNFARSLGRRLQTPLSSLIFHLNYGSRIPPEVGAVQSADEAAKLLQYGNSAIRADPRTGSILASQATTQPGFLATYAASVLPIGPGSTAVSLNETIGARP